MDSVRMHIEFRARFNRINSNKNRGFFKEEIDLFLNDSYDEFVETRSTRKSNHKAEGFEDTQKRIDDIRTVVKEGTTSEDRLLIDDSLILLDSGVLSVFNRGKYVNLPMDGDYKYLKLVNDACDTSTNCATYRHSPNRLFSSEWVNNALKDAFHRSHAKSPVSEIKGNKLFAYEDGFTILDFHVVYVYQYPKIEYETQDCILPIHTHREIVNNAVDKVNSVINTGNYEKYLNSISKSE